MTHAPHMFEKFLTRGTQQTIPPRLLHCEFQDWFEYIYLFKVIHEIDVVDLEAYAKETEGSYALLSIESSHDRNGIRTET
jgi:hypothetical protein